MDATNITDINIPGYTILGKLGRGAMAQVYLSVQDALDRKVALKIMADSLLADPEFSDRFLREAKIVAQLSHPNIVSVYDVGIFQNSHYISMEYHPGGDLKSKIKKGISLDETLRISRQVALALRFAHQEGYIHRDVKPENILFDRDDNAVLTDFGLARSGEGASDMTAIGTVMGTPKYMSPEQAQGVEVDARSDLYSLGVMIFEMLSGQAPFDGGNAIAICHMHINLPIPELPEHLQCFQGLINKTMAKNPNERVSNGNDIINMLDVFTNSGLTAPFLYTNDSVGDNDSTLLRPQRGSGIRESHATSTRTTTAQFNVNETNTESFTAQPQQRPQQRPQHRQSTAAHKAAKSKGGGSKTLVWLAIVVFIAISIAVYVKMSPAPELPEIADAVQLPETTTLLLSSLQILAPQNQALCSSDTPYRDGSVVVSKGQKLRAGDCFSILVKSNEDLDVIIYSQSEDGSVYQLIPNSCNAMGLNGKPFSKNKDVTFPLDAKQELTVIGLDEKAGQEWIYAVAVQDAASRQSVLQSLAAIPDICSGRAGTYSVRELQDALNSLKQAHPSGIQWLSASFEHTSK